MNMRQICLICNDKNRKCFNKGIQTNCFQTLFKFIPDEIFVQCVMLWDKHVIKTLSNSVFHACEAFCLKPILLLLC